MENWNMRRGRGRVVEIIYLLDMGRKTIKTSIPNMKDALSSSIQSQLRYLEVLERNVLPGIDNAMHRLEVSSTSREIFEDFIEFRDSIKQLIYDSRRNIESGRNLVESFDKILYWADKKL